MSKSPNLTRSDLDALKGLPMAEVSAQLLALAGLTPADAPGVRAYVQRCGYTGTPKGVGAVNETTGESRFAKLWPDGISASTVAKKVRALADDSARLGGDEFDVVETITDGPYGTLAITAHDSLGHASGPTDGCPFDRTANLGWRLDRLARTYAAREAVEMPEAWSAVAQSVLGMGALAVEAAVERAEARAFGGPVSADDPTEADTFPGGDGYPADLPYTPSEALVVGSDAPGASPVREARGGADEAPGAHVPAPVSADRPAEASRKTLRRVAPAGSDWEKLRRLLCARCALAESLTGESADDLRHGAAWFASEGRTESSLQLSDDEMGQAVTWVEHQIHGWGFEAEMRAADAAFDARRDARARQFGDDQIPVAA